MRPEPPSARPAGPFRRGHALSRSSLQLTLALGLLLILGITAAQQPSAVPSVGVLMATTGPDDPLVETFRRGMRDLGYVEGRTIRIEHRNAQGHFDRLQQLAEELVQLRVDVIVATSWPARAAKQVTSTIPIVALMSDADPVASGLISSYSRPGGNVTGIFSRQPELTAKRLELLREMLPGISQVAVLWDDYTRPQLDALEAAARSLGVQVMPLESRPPYDFPAAFRAARNKKAGALIILPSHSTYHERLRAAAAALGTGLPATFPARDFVEAGGLFSFGPEQSDLFGRAAYFVDRLLKGAKPQDLPMEQTSKFSLIVSLRTAHALRLEIPQSILLRADEIIR